MMENQQQDFDPLTAVNVTVPKRAPRGYLVETEVERLMEAARDNRWGHRDATAILIAYRHGLRSSEVVGLRWDDFDLARGRLHVRRHKGGADGVHPVGRENCAPYGAYNGKQTQRRHSCSSASAVPRSVSPVTSA